MYHQGPMHLEILMPCCGSAINLQSRAACPTLIIGEGSAGQGYCLTILLRRTTRQRNRWGGVLLQLLS